MCTDEQKRGYKGPDRRRDSNADVIEPVLLTRKLAKVINGIDLGEKSVGDRLPLPAEKANLLIAEGWANPAPPEQRRSHKRR